MLERQMHPSRLQWPKPAPLQHQFRHFTFSHEWLRGGGSEEDLMALAGWKSRRHAQALRVVTG